MQSANKRERIKRSRIWLMPKEQFVQLVNNSDSYVAILKELNYSERGGGFRLLKERIAQEYVDDSHIKDAYKKRLSDGAFKEIPDNEVFIEHSTYASGTGLKVKLLKNGFLNQCAICSLENMWNNMALSLQLDHINGIRDDNRLDNLRLVCPNCHSQTSTFAGRNSCVVKKCVDCNVVIQASYTRCQGCKESFKIKQPKLKLTKGGRINKTSISTPRPEKRKVEWPTKEELEKLLWEMPTTAIGKQYGVSDKAVEKWAKNYGLSKPPRGYWQKQNLQKNNNISP